MGGPPAGAGCRTIFTLPARSSSLAHMTSA